VADPKTSALNRYLQSRDVPNLFVMDASAFPQNAGYNPTGTVAALALWSAKAIREPPCSPIFAMAGARLRRLCRLKTFASSGRIWPIAPIRGHFRAPSPDRTINTANQVDCRGKPAH
jgi:choline dehydrogenase-like flavoprotein